jgi:hypothetical protein
MNTKGALRLVPHPPVLMNSHFGCAAKSLLVPDHEFLANSTVGLDTEKDDGDDYNGNHSRSLSHGMMDDLIKSLSFLAMANTVRKKPYCRFLGLRYKSFATLLPLSRGVRVRYF